MMDPLSAAVDAISAHRLGALPMAALAGAATSIGPCVAPRYLALIALVGERRPLVTITAFTLGIVVVTVALGAGAGIAGALIDNIATIDALVAVALVAFGVATVIREPHACAHLPNVAKPRASGAFALGAMSALVVSPCCTPLIVAFAALGGFDRDPLFVLAILASFALGHAAPLFLAALTGASLAERVRALTSTAAPSTVAGGLTIALGCYYGLLA